MALPKFSTNYTRPGAYENPQAVVDTQSGAIWANAISNIGRITAQAIQNRQAALSKRALEDQKANDSNVKFLTEHTDKALNQIKQSGNLDPSFKEAVLFAVAKKGDAKLLSERGRTKDERAKGLKDYTLWSTRLTELIQYSDLGKTATEDYRRDYLDNPANVNTPGGIATTGYDERASNTFILGMPAYGGFSKNSSRKWGFDEENDFNIVIQLNSDNIANRKNKDGSAMYPNGIKTDPVSLFSYDPGTIDNLDSSILKIYEDQGIYNSKKGEINENYLNLSKTEPRFTENKQYEYQFTPLNKTAIEGSTSNFIAAKASSYLRFVDKANNLWETTLAQGRNILGPDGEPLYPEGFKLKLSEDNPGSAFDKESSDIFTQSLAQHAWGLLPAGKESSLKKVEVEKPTEGEIKRGKAVKESKSNYDIAKKLIAQEGKIPDVPTQPSVFDPSGQLTNESNRFKEAMSAIVTGSNGELVEFVESERTGEPSARVKYPGQPEIEISLAEFRNKDLFDAKIQKATGAGTSGLETYYDINLD